MRFSFYQVSSEYCDFLRQKDRCVPYTMDCKSMRPFVGIVFTVNGFHYYAPLTSPKPKHLHMKNQIDFLKINGGIWGAINFNNMIPVHNDCLRRVEMKVREADTKAEMDYKNLLSNQLSWCNANRDAILRQAQKLYDIVTKGSGRPELTARCCKFLVDEAQSLAYSKLHQ